MKANKVFATSNLFGNHLTKLADVCCLEVWQGETPPTPQELSKALSDAYGLICLLTDSVTSTVIASAPHLEFVSSMSAGIDHVDVQALSQRNIPLGYTPGVLTETTADLTWALLMAAARRIPEADQFVRAGQWTPDKRWSPSMFIGKDIAGATLGIIGLGAIGQAVARRAQGFGMNVIAWTRSKRDVAQVKSVDFDSLLTQSDFVCVCVALTDTTNNLLDASAIAKMKTGAVLVNTARGGIVDEIALARALSSGHLFAAGFDVFAGEPVDMNNPLLKLPNLVVAPHIGSASVATRDSMASLAVDNALAALSNTPMPHCVNPEVYAKLT